MIKTSRTSANVLSLRRTAVPRNCSLILLARSPCGRHVRTTTSTLPAFSRGGRGSEERMEEEKYKEGKEEEKRKEEEDR